MFIGIIIGIVLTVGTVAIADALRPTNGADELATRPMVNWDVVDYNIHSVSTRIQDIWARLTNRNRNEG